MGKGTFRQLLVDEVSRIDESKTSKRHEHVIESFTPDHKAVIEGKHYTLFNSNDYLGLRFHPVVKLAEEQASDQYGAGPGAVRFISGTMKVHRDLEKAIAKFHGRQEAMIFSSAFAANMGVIHSMIKGQSRDSLVGKDTLVVSDALNHRSIIDSVRIAGLGKENKVIFDHLDLDSLDKVLSQNAGKFSRVVVITDGIFSMVGEYQDINKLQAVADKHDGAYEQGIVTIVDDAHGVGGFGATGRGTEEHTGGKCDLLIGTLGKGFGSDGGYVTGDSAYIEYMRESVATYIYSNPTSPGTAGAGLAAIELMNSDEGQKLLSILKQNIKTFKDAMKEAGFKFTADSSHAIQPILIGDAKKSSELTRALFDNGIVVTNISYPVVAKGLDEIRAQLSALHTPEDIKYFVKTITKCAKQIGIL